MLKTVLRISVMYLSSVIVMRLAGKKEVSQLELSELVTSFMVSEIACMPITDPDVPLYEAVVFVVAVAVINLSVSHLAIRLPMFKHLVAGKPSFLVVKGKICRQTMYKAKVSLSELVSAMRKNGVCSLDNVNYAVLEPDGNISIIPKNDEDEKSEADGGLEHMLVADGKINKSELEALGYTSEWLMERIKCHGKNKVEQIFFFGVDDEGNERVIFD